MKIAMVLSDVSYPPREGLHQQSTMLAAELQSRGHQVTVFTYGRSTLFDADVFTADTGVGVVTPSRRVRAGALVGAVQSAIPGTSAWNAQREFARSIRKDGFHAVHIEGALGSMLPVRASEDTRVVMSWVDLGSARYSRLARQSRGVARLRNRVAQFLYFAFESRAAQHWKVWHFVSPTDADASRNRWATLRTCAIPPMIPAHLYEREREAEPHRFLVFADLRQDYVRRAYLQYMAPAFRSPELAQRVQWEILGRVPADSELASIEGTSRVEYLDWVEDYVAELHRAHVVVLPDGVGSGIKNRFLQSLALGSVTVATATAAEGVPAVDGDHFAQIDSPADLPRVLSRLLDDPESTQALSVNARKFARGLFHPDAVTKSWIDEYGEHRG